MRRKSRNIAAVLCLTLLGVAIPAYFLLCDQSQATRDQRFNRTLAELRRGNYFAWAQLRLWLNELTPKEEMIFDETCIEYVSTNHVLHVTGLIWPPEPTSPGFRGWSAWLKGAIGMEDRTLAYDVIAFPPLHDIHLNSAKGITSASIRTRPSVASTAPVLVNQPAAVPLR